MIPNPVRILVADDHEIVRKGLIATLQTRTDWIVCGEADNGREAVEKAMELRPHVVVMDLTMPELNGLEATRRIRKGLPDTEILVLSMHDSEQLVREVLETGARGYVLKSDAGNAIFEAIDSLVRHEPFFTSRISASLLHSLLGTASGRTDTGPEGQPLTPRERETVQLIAEGLSTKEVAAKLDISVKTADTHRSNLMRKLNMHSVSELVRYAIRNAIITP